MDLIRIPLGGLASKRDDNLIRLQEALIATDCFLDNDTVKGRPGSRAATASAVGSSSTVQGTWRFRPTLTSVRTIVVQQGKVYLITDPSSDTASDGTVTLLGTPFADGDLVSGAQLGTNFYLGSNASGTAMQRVKWTTTDTYTLESLQAIPQGDKPSSSLGGQVAWTAFSTITPTVSGCVVQTNSNTGMTNMAATWRALTRTNNGNNDPVQGAYAQYKLAAAVNAMGNDWLAIAISPHDAGGFNGPGWQVTIQVAIDSGGPGTFQTIGAIYDVPPIGGAPNLIFCDLRALDKDVRKAIRWIQFTVDGSNGGKFILYGYMFLPGRPADPPPFRYYVDFYDGSYTAGDLTGPSSVASGQASPLTTVLEVTLGNANIASYPDSYMTVNEPANSNQNDVPFTFTDREFNFQAGKARPTLAEVGNVVTITGTAPTFSSPASLTARLWEDTSSGRRLVAVQSTVTSGSAYTLVDNGGLQKLANQLYKAGGVLALGINCLAAHAGRLIAGGVGSKAHRLYVSSFTPPSDTSNPFPQWPDIALEDADGWSFDLAPAPNEQIVAVNGEGDALYMGTNLAVYSLGDLRPNTVPYLVLRKGVISRRAFCFAEEFIFWSDTDGLYMAANRSRSNELSRVIRRLYKETFLPDQTVVVAYDIATRSILIFKGTSMLRHSFSASEGHEWTGPHTLADNVAHVASWIDPPGTTRVTPQFWMYTTGRKIGRLQATATRDMEVGTDATTGTALPDWSYSSGFDPTPVPGLVKGLLVDCDRAVRVTVASTASGENTAVARQADAVPRAGADEVWLEGFGDFRAYKFRFQFDASSTTTLRRAEFGREPVEAK